MAVDIRHQTIDGFDRRTGSLLDRGLPRDVWGLPPLSALQEFARKPTQPTG